MSRRRELRRGLAATAPYLLSHHTPDEHYRCHRLPVAGRTVHLCARCSGVYPGIALGVVAFLLGVAPGAWFPVVALGPLPALVDWALTTLTDRRGKNAVRTATGGLLGLAYGLAVPWFLTTWRPGLAAVAVGYGTLALVGLRSATE
ncbi:DUF2085 domain-containing protein [Haloarcula nitratireducens]|uniref:DUF2085 domain-containing protein n=1 Tax=Haloarcula nitratireducens TaxID=2487749 RepID=A0AAW4PBM4_9EURY|nr:DUF2085 domain-containing protein [Halomicroarcula nitratireducens]MBX0295566.1 DUF2085 domain-containing protein [Halomicroarcula nitratireducens]